MSGNYDTTQQNCYLCGLAYVEECQRAIASVTKRKIIWCRLSERLGECAELFKSHTKAGAHLFCFGRICFQWRVSRKPNICRGKVIANDRFCFIVQDAARVGGPEHGVAIHPPCHLVRSWRPGPPKCFVWTYDVFWSRIHSRYCQSKTSVIQLVSHYVPLDFICFFGTIAKLLLLFFKRLSMQQLQTVKLPEF